MTPREKYRARIAANLRRLMEEHHPPLTLRALGSLSGVPFTTVHAVVLGRHDARLQIIADLAQALGVRVDDLLQEPAGRPGSSRKRDS